MLKFRQNIILIILFALLGVNNMSAVDVLVNVSPKQNPLPPNALAYKDTPGKYFNVTLTNMNNDTKIDVRLEVAIEGPKDQLSNQWEDRSSYLKVAANRTTPKWFTLLPNRPMQISGEMLNDHFQQYDPETEFFSNGQLRQIFDDVNNFGLLPEGHYTLKVIVKPNNGYNADVIGEGVTHFDIAYKASAPKFTEPTTNEHDFTADEKGYQVIPFPVELPRFSWTVPSFNMQNLQKKAHFVYDFCIARIMEGQTPTEAFDKRSVAFEQRGLITPFCNVPTNIVRAMRNSGTRFYVAQVTAVPMINNSEHPDYAVVEKNGKSQMIVLDLGDSDDDEGKKDDDIKIPDFDVDANTDPVKATITPKMTILTNVIKPYITEPGKLFDVTLENTTTQDLEVSLLLQFHKENWGVCASPSSQHSDRSIILEAKKKITLTSEELNRLAGEYDYEKDAIIFKAKTGFIIGKPSSDVFPENNNNVSLRVCQFTGKPVLRERIIGKARNTFNVNANVVMGEKIMATIEPKMEVLPSEAIHYIEHPERLFKIEMQNLTDKELHTHPALSYYYDEENRLRGEDDQHKNLTLNFKPKEKKTLTDDEVYKLFGGYKKAAFDFSGGSMEVELKALTLKDTDNEAFLTIYDAERLETLPETDEERYTKARMQEVSTRFNTSRLIRMGNIELKFTNKYTSMPDNVSLYFEQPNRLFTIEVKNLTDKEMRLRPEINYLLVKGSNDYFKSQEKKDVELPFITLAPNETATIPEELLEQVCANNIVERVCPDDDLVMSAEYSDIQFVYDDLNKSKVVMYNVDSLEKISKDDPSYVERCTEGTAICSFAVGRGSKMMDIDIHMTPRLKNMPMKAQPYFNRTYSIWDIELVNNTKFPKRSKLVLSYKFENDKYIYTTDKKNDRTLFVNLKANEKRKLTRQEINQLFCSENLIRYKEEKGIVSDEESLHFKKLETKCGSLENHAIIKIYNADKIEESEDKKATEMMLIGETDVTFQATEGAELNDILVTLKHKMNPMPGDGNHYFKNPGIIFEATLENTSLEELKVLPVMNFIFEEDGGYYGGSPKTRLDSALVIKPEEKIVITEKELNRVCGYFEEINHYTTTLDGHNIEKIKKFDNLVNLKKMNEAHMTVYNTDSLRLIPETEKDRDERSFVGEGKTQFMADKNMKLTTLKVEVTPIQTSEFPCDAKTYFTDPGKYFNVTISNTSGEKARVNLRLTFNDRYCINKPDSSIVIEPEMVKKLTSEEINDLCAQRSKDKIYEINTNRELVLANNPDDIKFEGGENHITSLVWRKLENKAVNVDVDTLAAADTLFVAAFREVTIGKYKMVLEEAKKDSVNSKTGDNCYSGYGYIKWNPIGLPLRIAVEYKGLNVNSKAIVTKGEVFSQKPKEFFSWEDVKKELENIAPEEYKDSLSARLEGSKIAKYYNYVSKDMKILNDLTKGKITLPARLPNSLTENSPVEAQLTSMYFTPDTATMNVLVEFVVPESNYVETSEGILVFAAENLPIGEDTWLPESGIVKLVTDFKVKDPQSQFDFTFRAPTSKEGEKTEDGCYVAWENSEFKEVTVDVSISLPDKKLVKYYDKITEEMENNGIDESPDIRMVASIRDSEDWFGYVTMDSFQFRDAPGYTFTLTGETQGMLYDHSKERTPSGVNFPSNYDWEEAGFESADREGWQGFYFEELSVSLPKFIELNDKGSNRRLKVGMKNMIGDKSGFTCEFFTSDVLSKSTAKIGGWAITIDTLKLNIIQNDFANFNLNGKFDVPLLDGWVGYEAKVLSIKSDENEIGNKVIFETRQTDDLSMDFWLAKADFNKEKTYFNVTYTDFPKPNEKNTTIELCAGGIIDITCTDKLDFIFKEIKFDGLRVANFKTENKTDNIVGQSSKKSPNDAPKKISEVSDKDGNIIFDMGNWSFASKQKDFWKLPFTLKEIYLTGEGTDQLGLYINGGLSVLGDKKTGVGATTGIIIWSKVDWESLDIAYDKVQFKDLQVDGSFGGALTIKGELEVSDEEKKSGYKGELKLDVNGLFELSVGGEYLEVKKDKEFEYDNEEEKKDSTYKAGYFISEAKFKNLPSIAGMKLSSLMGGIYIHYGMDQSKDLCKKDALMEALLHPILRYKSYGGAFGLGLAVGNDNLIKGDFNLMTIIDMKNGGKLSDFHLQGNVNAMCADGADKGLINAQADIIYSDNTTSEKDTTTCKRFKINITADAGIKDMATAYEAFTGHKLEMPKPLSDLQEFSQEAADEQGDDSNGTDRSIVNADGTREKSKAEKKAEENTGLGSMGVTANLEFEFRHYPDRVKKNIWHLYLGQPSETDRLRITFIDFAIGKDEPIGVWAKLYANAYLCLGNELPDNGALPEVPEKILTALGMKGADGEKHPEQTDKLKEARLKTIKDGPCGNTDGGIMFGAALGGEFGCNALFCYADVEAMLGFDLILKKFSKDCLCTDGKRMGGKNGFYAMGQLYSMMSGELGLMIDLWIFEGKVPLVSMSLGALLKGGFPNPSWGYGRLRAKGEILGGIIKFNSTLEAKVGRVCIPEYGNPLEDIKIFGDVQPGEDNLADGWKKDKPTSCYITPSFTTNMRIDSRMALVDEGARAKMAGMNDDESKYTTSASRTYVFHLKNDFLMEKFAKEAADDNHPISERYISYNSTDRINFSMTTGSLEPHTRYKITLRGYCKEIVDGREVDPIFKDKKSKYKNEHRKWEQECLAYFLTGKLTDNINEEIKGFVPDNGVFGGNLEEVTNPYAMLEHVRDDYFDNPDYEFKAEVLQRYEKSDHYICPDLMYNNRLERIGRQKSDFENIEIVHNVEKVFDEELYHAGRGGDRQFVSVGLAQPLPGKYFKKGAEYRFRIYRTNTKKMKEYFSTIEEKYNEIMAMTKEERDKLENELDKLNEDEENTVLQDLYKYYKEVDKKYGENTAKQRMRKYADQKKEESYAYTDVIIEKNFFYNGKENFHDQFIAKDSYFLYNDKKAEYAQPSFSLTAIHHNGGATVNVHNNPYRALNYWSSTACVWDSNLKPYNLCEYPYNSPEGISYTASYGEYRKANTSNAKKLDDEKFEKCYAPEFAHLSPMPNKKWHIMNVSDLNSTCYTNEKEFANEKFNLGYGAPTGYTGAVQLHTFVNAIKSASSMDSQAATLLEDSIHKYWNMYTDDDNYENAYKMSGPYDTKKDHIANSIYRARQESERKAYFTKWKNAMNLAMEHKCYIEIKKNYGTPMSYSLTLPEAQLGLMYAASDPTFKLGMDSHCTDSYVGKYMSRKERLYNHNAFVENTKNDEYVVNIRRATGYDIINSEFALRPFNKYQNQLKTVIRAGKIDDRSVEYAVPKYEYEDIVYLEDVNFSKYILDHFDTNKDQRLQVSEAKAIDEIHYKNENGYKSRIDNLTGIEAMTNLEILYINNVGGYGLENVNLGNNTKLATVRLLNSSIKKLDLRMAKDLKFVELNNNKDLVDIKLPKSNKIWWLKVDNCAIKTLDCSNMRNLEHLSCTANILDSLNLTNCQYLKDIKIGNQQKDKNNKEARHLLLNIPYNIKIMEQLRDRGARPMSEYQNGKAPSNATANIEERPNANVFYNYKVPNIWDLDKNLATYLVEKYGQSTTENSIPATQKMIKTEIDQIKLKRNLEEVDTLIIDRLKIKSLDGLDIWTPNLKYLYARGNYIEHLDLGNFGDLIEADIRDNRIKDMRLSNLKQLNCSNNQLEILDVQECDNLSKLVCENNSIEEIKFKESYSLKVLHCANNNINKLDLSKQHNLQDIDISFNTIFADESNPNTATRLILPETTTNLHRLVANNFALAKEAKLNLSAYSNLKYVDVSKTPNLVALHLPSSIEQLRARDCHNLGELSPASLSTMKNINTFDVANSNVGKEFPQSYNTLEEFDITNAHRHVNGKINEKLENIKVNSANLKVIKVGDPLRKKGNKIRLDLLTSDMVTLWQNTWSHYEENKWTVIAYFKGEKLNPKESDKVETITDADIKMKEDMGEYYEVLKKKYNPNGRMLHTEDVKDITTLDCRNSKIKNLTGIIKWMPKLKELYASNNLFNTVNLAYNEDLEIVDLSENKELSTISKQQEGAHNDVNNLNANETGENKEDKALNTEGAPMGKKIKVLDVSHTNVFSYVIPGNMPAGSKTGMDYALTHVSDRIIAVGTTGGGNLNIDKNVYVCSLNLTDADVHIIFHEGEYKGMDSQKEEETKVSDKKREELNDKALSNAHDVIVDQIRDKGQLGTKPGRQDIPGMSGVGRLPNLPNHPGGVRQPGSQTIVGNSKAIASTVVPSNKNVQMSNRANQKMGAIKTNTISQQQSSRASQRANTNVHRSIENNLRGTQQRGRRISLPGPDEAPEITLYYMDINVSDTLITPAQRQMGKTVLQPDNKQKNKNTVNNETQQQTIAGRHVGKIVQGNNQKQHITNIPTFSMNNSGRLDSLICNNSKYDIIVPAADYIYSIKVFQYGNTLFEKSLKFHTADLALKWILEWSKHGNNPTTGVLVCVRSGSKASEKTTLNKNGLYDMTTIWKENYFKYTLAQLLEAADKGLVEKGKYYDTFRKQLEAWISTTVPVERPWSAKEKR